MPGDRETGCQSQRQLDLPEITSNSFQKFSSDYYPFCATNDKGEKGKPLIHKLKKDEKKLKLSKLKINTLFVCRPRDVFHQQHPILSTYTHSYSRHLMINNPI